MYSERRQEIISQLQLAQNVAARLNPDILSVTFKMRPAVEMLLRLGSFGRDLILSPGTGLKDKVNSDASTGYSTARFMSSSFTRK